MAGATDFLRSDPEYQLGITGAMKIAHLGEVLGIDRDFLSAHTTRVHRNGLACPKTP